MSMMCESKAFGTTRMPYRQIGSFSETGSFAHKLDNDKSYIRFKFRGSVNNETAVLDFYLGFMDVDGTIRYVQVIDSVTVTVGNTDVANGTKACDDISVANDYSDESYRIIGAAAGTANDNKFLVLDSWGATHIKVGCPTTAPSTGTVYVDIAEM